MRTLLVCAPVLVLVACTGSGLSPDLQRARVAEALDSSSCVEGAFLEDHLATDTGACGTAVHAFGGAEGSTVGLGATGAGRTFVTVSTVGGDFLASASVGEDEALAVELPWSGEFIATFTPDDPAASVLDVHRVCLDGCDRSWTRYPLVLVHGMAGTDTYLGVLDYWFGIEDPLRAAGYEVFVPAVDPFQVTPVRSQTWAMHLDAIASEGRHRRFNLIGHSQGGMDSRYVAAHLDPERRVASVLTIATPHRGVSLTGVVSDAVESTYFLESAIDGTFDVLAGFYGLDSDQDIVAQVGAFSPDAMDAFNDAVPDRPDVYYASWSGRTCQALDFLCLWQTGGEIVTPLLAPTQGVLEVLEGDNDGLVGVESAKWGVHYGSLGADHLDQVGQVGGLTGLGFDAPGFFLDEAAWLRTIGL
jgi:triacylglycerol esterase/lipase EstA (alpha/beta hydrolase family)